MEKRSPTPSTTDYTPQGSSAGPSEATSSPSTNTHQDTMIDLTNVDNIISIADNTASNWSPTKWLSSETKATDNSKEDDNKWEEKLIHYQHYPVLYIQLLLLKNKIKYHNIRCVFSENKDTNKGQIN